MPWFFFSYFFLPPFAPFLSFEIRSTPFVVIMPGTVTNLLKELNWILLKVRRTILRLTLFHKAINRDGGLAFPYYVMKRRRHLRNRSQNNCILNCCQILRLIRIVIFVELSRTGMCYEVKLLTLSLQIDWKKSYLSILVNDEF